MDNTLKQMYIYDMSEVRKINKVVNPPIAEISANTNVVFTVKTFFGFIGILLGIFFGFYQLVIAPNQTDLKKNQSEIKKEVQDNNLFMVTEFGKMNNRIDDMNSVIETHYRDIENEKASDINRITGKLMNPGLLPYQDTIINNIKYSYPLNQNNCTDVVSEFITKQSQ